MEIDTAVQEASEQDLTKQIADALQDICKDNPLLQSATVALNWHPALTEHLPPGIIVTSVGDVDQVPGTEIVEMMKQWLVIQSKLARMLVDATERSQMKLNDAAVTLKHVEALHDKARTTQDVTTPFREILRIAASEGSGNAIAHFEEWFCRLGSPVSGGAEGDEEEGEEEVKAPGSGETVGGGGGRPDHPPPILRDQA